MGSRGKAGPSAAWFILPCILLLGAAVLMGLGITSLVHFIRSDFRAYSPGSSITATTDGFALYVEGHTTAAANLRCIATGPDGQVALPPSTGQSLTNGQGAFVAVASTPADLPPGQYVVSCVSTSGNRDIPLYVGPRLDLAALGRGIGLGIIAPVFLGV
ncbi:MAG: hypothetical protein QOF35_896, partial [Actinomycetota bacterium]|nr:hypothetical protein [Actinomycetota bacterium]